VPLTERRTCEVAVAGGGTAGIITAIAAARTGARTVLVEQDGFVGGSAVMGLPMHGFYNNREERILAGVAGELIARLEAMDAAAEVRNVGIGMPRGKGSPKFNARWTVYHPEAFKFVALEMLREAGVDLMLHTFVADVTLEGKAITGLVTADKSGLGLVRAARVVDCTGDGDVAARAGAPFEKGRPDDGRMQPLTLLFSMSNVDLERAEQAGAARRRPFEVLGSSFWQSHCRSYDVQLGAWSAALQQEMPAFAGHLTQFLIWDYGDGTCYCGNMVHIAGLDASDGDDLSKAEWIGRRLVWQLAQFARRHIPGFEQSFLTSTPARIGVRETRRILGEYYLTEEDILGAARSEDVVALCGYRMDVHGYDGGPVYHEPARGTQVKDCGAYDIPYGCLVPKGVENLLVAGRCVSASHLAQSSLRVQGPCMGMGHAAGTAAALSLRLGVSPRELEVRVLQEQLLQQGALLEPRA